MPTEEAEGRTPAILGFSTPSIIALICESPKLILVHRRSSKD